MGTFAWELSLGSFRFGTFAWELWLGNQMAISLTKDPTIMYTINNDAILIVSGLKMKLQQPFGIDGLLMLCV